MVIYETTNLITGTKYIGRDKYNNPEYLGSGLLLQRAIKKYGRENFTKLILEECTTNEELNLAECKWIDKYNATSSPNYYNIADGGQGGNLISNLPQEQYNDLMKKRSKFMTENNPMAGKTHTDENKKKMSHPGKLNGMYGKKQTAETKQLQKEKAKGRYTLEWFIQKNGIELGTQLYDERNTMLKNRKMRGEDNPAFRYVNLEELDNFVRNTDISHRQIAIHFGVGNTALLSKFKKLYNDNNLKRIRTNLNSN